MARSPYQSGQVIVGLKDEISWFSYPGYSDELKHLEPKCLDGEHLLVNARVKVCKDGMLGLQKEAWHQVAEVYPDVISKSLVVDLVDKQSAANAKRTFPVKVEEAMTKLGYENEAEFCRLIWHWYSAEDDPGIPALQRVRYRLDFKNFLLRDVDFGRFPTYGSYIKGIPKGMFEGVIQSIDTHLQLYALCKNGTFNQRAISSLVNETFFGELAEIEPTRLSCPKAVNIPRLMASSVTEIMHYRHNPGDR